MVQSSLCSCGTFMLISPLLLPCEHCIGLDCEYWIHDSKGQRGGRTKIERTISCDDFLEIYAIFLQTLNARNPICASFYYR